MTGVAAAGGASCCPPLLPTTPAWLASALKRARPLVVASYSRAEFRQTGDGHFSPIGGYHPQRDLVLIMDTARYVCAYLGCTTYL